MHAYGFLGPDISRRRVRSLRQGLKLLSLLRTVNARGGDAAGWARTSAGEGPVLGLERPREESIQLLRERTIL